MSHIAGIDVSTTAVDIVLLDEDTRTPTWTHCPLQPALQNGSRDDLRPARSAKNAIPGRSWWEHHGVVQVAVEDPFSNRLDTAKKLGRVVGAAACCLPPDMPVLLITPVEMRQWLSIEGRMTKEQLRGYAAEHGAPVEEWNRDAELWGLKTIQDALDAYVVALAALARIERELRRTAT